MVFRISKCFTKLTAILTARRSRPRGAPQSEHGHIVGPLLAPERFQIVAAGGDR
jgi:hypothetical protein